MAMIIDRTPTTHHHEYPIFNNADYDHRDFSSDAAGFHHYPQQRHLSDDDDRDGGVDGDDFFSDLDGLVADEQFAAFGPMTVHLSASSPPPLPSSQQQCHHSYINNAPPYHNNDALEQQQSSLFINTTATAAAACARQSPPSSFLSTSSIMHNPSWISTATKNSLDTIHHVNRVKKKKNDNDNNGLLPQQQQCTVSLRHVELVDHNGHELHESSQRIHTARLLLLPRYFGISFVDSSVGGGLRSVAQLHPADIVALVRQSDRIALYIKLRRPAACGLLNDDADVSTTTTAIGATNGSGEEEMKMMDDNDDDQQQQQQHYHHHLQVSRYYADSPFSNVVNMLLYFDYHGEIGTVFDHVQQCSFMMHHLKMVYQGWMFCADVCTRNDLETIVLECDSRSLQTNNLFGSKTSVRKTIKVNRTLLSHHDGDGEETQSMHRRSRSDELPHVVQPYRWARGAIGGGATIAAAENVRTTAFAREMKLAHARPRQQKTAPNASTKQKLAHEDVAIPPAIVAILDVNMLHLVLPVDFFAIDAVVKSCAMELLKKGSLQPYQFTVGLCRMLQVATADASRKRAMRLLHTMTKYPNVQLTALSHVGRYLLQGEDCLADMIMQPSSAGQQPNVDIGRLTTKDHSDKSLSKRDRPVLQRVFNSRSSTDDIVEGSDKPKRLSTLNRLSLAQCSIM